MEGEDTVVASNEIEVVVCTVLRTGRNYKKTVVFIIAIYVGCTLKTGTL